MKYYLYLIVILTTQSGCKSNAPKYESKYQAAYEYINNCENLTFWKEDICDEKYKDMFPINIIPDIFPDGKDASGFKPLIVFRHIVSNAIGCSFPKLVISFHLKVDCQSAIFHSYSFSTMIIQ